MNNGANDGLWYVNGNNGLTNTNWNIASRQSGWASLSTFRHDYPALARERQGISQLNKRNCLEQNGLVADANAHVGNQRLRGAD